MKFKINDKIKFIANDDYRKDLTSNKNICTIIWIGKIPDMIRRPYLLQDSSGMQFGAKEEELVALTPLESALYE